MLPSQPLSESKKLNTPVYIYSFISIHTHRDNLGKVERANKNNIKNQKKVVKLKNWCFAKNIYIYEICNEQINPYNYRLQI